MIRVVVDSIRVSLLTQQRIVLLRDNDNRRYLSIFIDPFMAEAIARAMQGDVPPRPMTHDLLKNIVSDLGGTIEYALITQLQDGAYHAVLMVQTRNGQREIDSRSSDAIALALRADAPIYAEEALLEQYAQTEDEPDVDAEEEEEDVPPRRPAARPERPVRSERPERPTPAASEEGEERDVNEESLSLFRDFINSLEKPKPPEEGS